MMAARRRRPSLEDRPMADINVTPLVDVMLVLLVIFMVTAPMMQMGIDVAEEKIVLSVNAQRELFLNRIRVPLGELRPKLEAIFAARIEREVFLRADRTVPYGFVVEVMSEVRRAGIDKLGMITEAPEERG